MSEISKTCPVAILALRASLLSATSALAIEPEHQLGNWIGATSALCVTPNRQVNITPVFNPSTESVIVPELKFRCFV